MTTWTDESYDTGDWAVYDNGNSVQQNVNGLPTFFYSDFSAMGGQAGLRLTTHVSVNTTEDNDYIGIAVGFNPGDTTNPNADYLLIDWKQNGQTKVVGDGLILALLFHASKGSVITSISGNTSAPLLKLRPQSILLN